MSMFNDPGNLLALAIILILGYFIFRKRKSAPDLPLPAPLPVPEPDSSIDYEDYYNNKYPKVDILYDGRKVPWREGLYKIDVRDFFNPYDSQVRNIVRDMNIDLNIDDHIDNARALACFNWVRDNVKYAYDLNPSSGSKTDYWNFPFETLLPRMWDSSQLYGDCEDQAILLANLLLASGVAYWKIRPTAGVVSDGTTIGGHVFTTFFDEPRERWVLLDTIWYPSSIPIMSRKNYKDEAYVKKIWFSWNMKYAFSKADVKMTSGFGFNPQIVQKGE